MLTLEGTDTSPKSKERKPKPDAKFTDVSMDIQHPELFERLRAWRNAEAARLNLPAYTVLAQKALIGISNLLPLDKTMLLRIPYIGKKSVEKYGDEILEKVRAYQKERGSAVM